MDFDEMKQQAENVGSEHSDQVDQAVDQGAAMAKEKVGHDAQVDQGSGWLKGLFKRKS